MRALRGLGVGAQAVPQLRTSSNIKAFNNEMRQCNYDLNE